MFFFLELGDVLCLKKTVFITIFDENGETGTCIIYFF